MRTAVLAFLKVSCTAIVVYLLVVGLAYGLGEVVTGSAMENYQWRIQRAMQRGDFTAAAEIAKKRASAEYYDFANHRALALALMGNGKSEIATSVLLESLDRGQRAAGRGVFSVGYNPTATYELLARALKASGRTAYAGEISRILADLNGTRETIMSDTSENFANITWLDLKSANLQLGCKVNGGTLSFDRNSTASVDITSGGEALIIEYRGEVAAGMGALMRISMGDAEIIRLYGNSTKPRWISVPLNVAEQKSRILNLSFINDLYEPISKTDRNFEVLRIGLKSKG